MIRGRDGNTYPTEAARLRAELKRRDAWIASPREAREFAHPGTERERRFWDASVRLVERSVGLERLDRDSGGLEAVERAELAERQAELDLLEELWSHGLRRRRLPQPAGTWEAGLPLECSAPRPRPLRRSRR